MRINPRQQPYDVVIVGSGAGGGMAAYVLTRAGANVLMLEAGVDWDNTRDSAMFAWPYETAHRGGSTHERQFGEFDAGLGGWSLDGEPYRSASGSSEFMWFRTRMLGGRTNHWGRISLRFGPDDFRRKSLDGLGDDWPISYDDVEPYYERVERLIGVFGSEEHLPNAPDSIFLPPPRPRCYELVIKRAAEALNVTCVSSRLSILTRSIHNRAPCHYCSQCNRGCAVNANFTSTNVLLPPARATGNLTIKTSAMVREVTVGDDGHATGVSYIDKTTGMDEHARGRIVVLAASACSSARILLNSRTSGFPDGVANSSGLVGKYLTDTTGTYVSGYIPTFENGIPHNEDGVGGGHIYMPWWLDNAKLDFPRGYHIEVGGGRHMPGAGFMGGIHRYPNFGGYGAALKNSYRRLYGTSVGFAGRGEMIPNDDSYCEIDPDTVDRWGIPTLRFHWKWTDYEHKQVKHMQETFRALIDQMGGEVFSPMPGPERGYGISRGGEIIHELGGSRMGNAAATSVVNRWQQAWDVPNLFVCDGGPFVSQADKNPTWTILALAWRAADKIVEMRNAREL